MNERLTKKAQILPTIRNVVQIKCVDEIKEMSGYVGEFSSERG